MEQQRDMLRANNNFYGGLSMDNNAIKLKKIYEIAKDYRYLDLKNFISMSLAAADYDLSMMDNVYFDEIVELPDVFGVYEKDDKLFCYYTNERAQMTTKQYDDPGLFMAMFVQTAPYSTKYISNSNVK